ncbi:MAG TPA: sensor histidine kinase, partial [Candidatus Merdisoma faecalis]|nr:sensor histidine kinase [Candidatus Merdisoma faecalis]
MLLVICLVPLTVLILYLVVIMQQFSGRYDEVVENITKANAYNIDFKDDLDYQMYIIVANSERADELIDTEEPRRMIEEAREVFQGLYESADAEYGKQRLNRILKSLNILEDRVIEIETDAKVSGFYDKNMERLDLDIRVLTELIQEQIQEYIYYETTNLEVLREGIRSDVDRTLRMTSIIFLLILVSAFLISQKLMQGIMVPIGRLCEVTRKAAGGDFTVRAKEDNSAELSVLNSSFNSMIEKIGNLVEDIRVEQLNLRATELKLLQAQINPHFLYNTLDTIIWLAEAGKKDDVVMMVTTLSDFFRTTLSKGRDYISVREEEAHIRSYLQIQQFRYRDILEYSIDIPEELYEYPILKLTLQPLVENALYHGIKNKRGLGHIRVSGEKQEGSLVFRVWDDGRGMESDRLEKVRHLIGGEEEVDRSDPSGFGLFNVAQRLRLNYGAQYGISLESVYG